VSSSLTLAFEKYIDSSAVKQFLWKYLLCGAASLLCIEHRFHTYLPMCSVTLSACIHGSAASNNHWD
jgi:hypothetical protein